MGRFTASVARLLSVALAFAVVQALVLSGLPGFGAAGAGAQPGGLFTAPTGQPDIQAVPADPTVRRSRYVGVDFAQLPARDLPPAISAAPPGAATLVLNLFSDVTLTVRQERLEPTSSGRGTIWQGRVDGVPASQVLLVVEDGVLVGNIAVGSSFYQVRFAGNGVHEVREIDQRAFPNEEEVTAEAADAPAALDQAPAANDSAGTIDVMVLYTPAAQTAAGGATAMANLVDLGVSETNTIYANSGITQRIRLVYQGQVSYAEGGDIEADLTRLRGVADGYMDQVHSLRNTYAADIVSLWVENGGPGICGIGYVMNSVSPSFASLAFNVVTRSCATGYYSFAHEMGHNMAARHDRFVDSGASSPYTYNYGYVAPDDAWRTVMAYGNACGGCTRVPYFSNPDVTYPGDGQPMGVPEGTASAADNRKTLNNTAATVANFRQSTVTPTTYTLTVTATSGGSATGGGTYGAGAPATLTATPDPGYVFLGWTLDGVFAGWPNPATLTMNANHTVVAAFAVAPSFPDVPASHPASEAITELAARGIIRGYQDGRFGPNDTTLRAQMAALIARAMGWDLEDHGNPFPDQGAVDADLWRNVGTLAYYNVARGYQDGRYRPTNPVLNAQVISFITRAMVTKGYWQQETVDDPALYPNITVASGHRWDVLTYYRNAGAIPGTDPAGAWGAWASPATRGWFALAQWQALDSYFGAATP